MSSETKKTLLLVEDEVILAMANKQTLENYGYKVIVATSGEKAIEVFKETNSIELILMDIDLGEGLDGTKAAEALLELKEIPVVFLSSHTEPEVVEKTEKITSYGYVVKNSGPTVLDASIKMAFKLFNANKQIKESEARLREVLENSSDVSYKRNLQTNSYDYLSPVFVLISGYTQEEINKMPLEAVMNLFHADDAAETKRVISNALNHPAGEYEVNYRFRHKNGQFRWFHDKFTVLRDATGKPLALIGSVSDITERKKSETAVELLALRNQTLLNATSDGIHVMDDQGKIIEVNPAFCKMLGYTREELLQLKITDWDVLYSERQILEKIEELIDHPAVFETRHRRKDGSLYEVEINCICIKLEGSNFLYASAHDITERKRAEDLLQQTRQNYETFFNTIDDFLFVLDEQGKIVHENSTVTNRLGYSREELLGKSVLMVHPPERREEAGRIVGEMLNGKAEFCPVPVITKSGVQIPVETRVSLGSWNGKPAIFGVTKDISKIQLSEEKFSKLFYINPSACGLSDLEDRKYIEVNEAFYSLLGFDKNEVIGRTATELGILTPEVIETILAQADENGCVNNVEADLRTKTGEIKHVLLSAENIFVQNRKYRFTVAHDITERKRAEEEVKNLLQEKEIILKEVHHRIKNNMSTINGLLTLQAESMEEPSPGRNALLDAGSRVQSMMVLYDKLYHTTNFQRISIANFIPSLVDEIVINFPNAEVVTIEKNIDDIELDVKRLQTLGIIINELLTNIMKYAFNGKEQGRINISVNLNSTTNVNSIFLVVEDNGNSIPESIDFQNSTGFGLMLVGLLTKQLKGNIRIERENGTRVILEFEM
ncbi:MAG: PAS domain S-box protein [Leptospiraceae bacterium]|nr:PAS domain S-box protein [Leptospiraceae bacterium]